MSSCARQLWVAALMAGAFVSAGCQIGPGRLKAANAHYSDAVRIANAEQLLANLVRLRYRESATFLAVTNISTQFEFNTALDVNGSVVTQGGADTVGIGGGLSYSEQPTISFSILGGEEFQKRMLNPLEVAAVSLLAEAGWGGAGLLRMTIEGMNGLPNAPTASGPTPLLQPEYEDFLEVSRLMRRLRTQRLLDFEYETRRETLSAPLAPSRVDGRDTVRAVEAGVEFELLDDGQVQLFKEERRLVMRFTRQADASPDAERLRELLRLEPGRRRFDLVSVEDSEFDPFDSEERLMEIAVDTRSLMGVFFYLANGVRIPPEDLDAGVVAPTLDAANNPFDWSTLLDGLFEVRWSDSLLRPPGAAVAVRHRGRWFYIADEDQTSKSTFLLISELFALQAGEVEEVKPVLTLPVGG